MTKIKIEGTDQLYNLSEVESSVIKLSGKWFWRDDTVRVVKIDGKNYRKASPLIVYSDALKTYLLKKDCVQTKDGIWLPNNSTYVTLVDGEYYYTKFCVNIKGKMYPKSDPRLTKCYITREFILKVESIQLSDKFYARGTYVSAENLNISKLTGKSNVVMSLDGYILSSDSAIIVTADNVKISTHVQNTYEGSFIKVGAGFKENAPSKLNSSNVGSYLSSIQNLAYAKAADSDNFIKVQGLSYPVHRNDVLIAQNKIATIIDTYIKPAVVSIRESLSYSDGKDKKYPENTAEIISFNGRRFRGNEILYKPKKTELNLCSDLSLSKVGGSKYTYGIEIETAHGLIDDITCEEIGVTKVGDGSITSAEYVTPPLHGDDGIYKLKKIMQVIANETFVDDKCAIHFHVGGAGNKHAPNPSFASKNLVRIIRLGCAIEAELFQMLPKSRTPLKKHCHSIMRYKNIDTSTVNNYVGHFVFGPEQNWDRTEYLTDYVYGSGSYNKNTTLNLYCGGRYKWLNLVNACTNTPHSTLEFRIFGGSTNFDKVYYQLLLCLAFMECVESSATLTQIDKMTLDKLVDYLPSNSTLKSELKDFITHRKKLFGRTKKNLYEGYTIPTFIKPSEDKETTSSRRTNRGFVMPPPIRLSESDDSLEI